VFLYQRLEQGVPLRAEHFLLHQQVAQGFAFFQHPSVHGCDQLIAGDEIQLQGEDAEKQVVVGCRRGLGHGYSVAARGVGRG